MADQTIAYEEFLRWKNSEQGQNIINQKNTTIIKSNKPDEPAAVIAEPKEIPDAAPRGLGNGLYSERSLGQMRSKLGVPPDPDAPWMKRRGRKPKHYETASQLEEPKKKKLRGGNHIGNCLEMARLDNSEQQPYRQRQKQEAESEDAADNQQRGSVLDHLLHQQRCLGHADRRGDCGVLGQRDQY